MTHISIGRCYQQRKNFKAVFSLLPTSRPIMESDVFLSGLSTGLLQSLLPELLGTLGLLIASGIRALENSKTLCNNNWYHQNTTSKHNLKLTFLNLSRKKKDIQIYKLLESRCIARSLQKHMPALNLNKFQQRNIFMKWNCHVMHNNPRLELEFPFWRVSNKKNDQ